MLVTLAYSTTDSVVTYISSGTAPGTLNIAPKAVVSVLVDITLNNDYVYRNP